MPHYGCTTWKRWKKRVSHTAERLLSSECEEQAAPTIEARGHTSMLGSGNWLRLLKGKDGLFRGAVIGYFPSLQARLLDAH